MAVDQKDWTGSAVSYVQQRYYAAGQELTSAIAPGGGDAVTFLAPAGSFVTAAGFRFGYTGPAGATSGTVQFNLYILVPGEHAMELTQATSNYNDSLLFDYGYWQNATVSSYPTAPQTPTWWSGHVGQDDTNGITMNFANSTNATINGIIRAYTLCGIQTVFQP